MCIVAHGTRRSKQICCAASEFPRRHAPSLHALRIWNFFLRFNGGQRLDGLSERAVVRPMDRRPRRPRAHARAPSASGARPAVCAVPRAVRTCRGLWEGLQRGSSAGSGEQVTADPAPKAERVCILGCVHAWVLCLSAGSVPSPLVDSSCFLRTGLCCCPDCHHAPRTTRHTPHTTHRASHPRSAPVHVARRLASGSP